MTITNFSLKGLKQLPDCPFKVRDDDAMRNLRDSIRQEGVITPIIVNSSKTDNIVVDGWRRVQCSVELRQEYIPAMVYNNLSAAEMMLMAVNSNISHRQLLISERAWAHRRKMEALKALISYGTGERSQSILAGATEESARTIQRLIRLTHLIPEWLDLIDFKRMALLPAVELSYLSDKEQKAVYECMCNTLNDGDIIRSTITHGQAIQLRALAHKGKLNVDTIYDVIDATKPNQKERIHIALDDISPYMPKGYSDAQCVQYLINLARREYERQIQIKKAKKEMER